MKPFKPMLAVACEDVTTIKYPVLLSEKLDGCRASIHNGVVMSRSMKPIPSKTVQEKFGKAEYEGYDGEIVYGDINASDVFNKSTRACMSVDLPEDFGAEQVRFYVFDKIGSEGYSDRYNSIVEDIGNGVLKLPQQLVTNAEDLTRITNEMLSHGAEGSMVRAIHGPYKQGRSTLKEGYLLKVKTFSDAECRVIGFEEKMHNANEATVGELGQTKRSSHKANMVPTGVLGSLQVVDVETGVEFNIGTGFTDEMRESIWKNRDSWMGKLVKYKSFKVGVVKLPRFPVFVEFIGERAEWDV